MSGQYGIDNFNDDTETIVYHEVGHLLHAAKNNYSSEQQLNKISWSDYTGLPKETAEKNLLPYITKQVGSYAASAPCEFVASVFAKLMKGEPVNKEIMLLYKKAGI